VYPPLLLLGASFTRPLAVSVTSAPRIHPPHPHACSCACTRSYMAFACATTTRQVHPEKLRLRLLHAAVALGTDRASMCAYHLLARARAHYMTPIYACSREIARLSRERAAGAEVMQGSVLDVELDADADGCRRRISSLVVRRGGGGSVSGAEGSEGGTGTVRIRARRVVFAMGAASAALNVWLSLDLSILFTRMYGILLQLEAPDPGQELPPSAAPGPQTGLASAGDLYDANLSALFPFPFRFCKVCMRGHIGGGGL